LQTFLPYLDYSKCAAVLDRSRLGKQRLEARQILSANLRGPGAGWYNHPVTKAWRGYELDLAHYGMKVCAEWAGRGYRDEQYEVFLDVAEKLSSDGAERVKPPWLVPALCSCHRAALLGKDFAHYSQFGWSERPTKGYEFPPPNGSTGEAHCPRDGFHFLGGENACPMCGMKNIFLEKNAYA